jgi:voltage-gated potassium channel Kch
MTEMAGTERADNELKGTTYELFIGALSVLSIFNLFVVIFAPGSPLGQVATIIDILLSVVFLADFSYRLFTAESKSTYFFRQLGWMDLISSLPFPQFKILRLTRIFRAARLMRKYGAKNMIREFIDNRAQSALLVLFFLIVLVLEFGGYLSYRVENDAPGANITTAADAVWYTFVTITTVGYGDQYPVTPWGRVIGVGIMIAGVGLFGTLTGYLANAFLAPPKKKPVESVETAGTAVDPAVAAMADLRRMLDESRSTQDALAAKVDELEAVLATRTTSG